MRQNEAGLKIIGITGNTGSGKGTVSGLLSEIGGYIIDADKLAHLVMEPHKDGYNEIVEYFGTEILNSYGCIDRKKLGRIVWNDRDKLEKLMEITHRYVLIEMFGMIDSLQENPGDRSFIVIDAPLLVEAGLHKKVDEVWLICAEEDIRMQRILARDGITSEDARARMKNQMPYSELRGYADVVIENNGGIDTLKERIMNVLHL